MKLRDDVGVATLSVSRGTSVLPEGDVLECEVMRERLNDVLVLLRTIGVEQHGAISIVEVEAIATTTVRDVEVATPGYEADAMPWALIEVDARRNAEPSSTFFVLMALAAIIAAIGIAIDSAVLIIGAMIVGPEYGPLTAVAVGLRRRLGFWRPAAAVLLGGLFAAVIAAAAFAVIAELVGEPRSTFEPTSRFFTAFVTDPNAYSAVVALVAGAAGTIALARSQATAVAGVLVSVTTIPAAAAIGVDLATAQWKDCWQAALQLGINVVAILVASLITLVAYDRIWRSATRR